MPPRRRAIPLLCAAVLLFPRAALFAQEATASPPVEQTPSSDQSPPPQEQLSSPEEATTAPPPVRTAPAAPRASSPRLTPEARLQSLWFARKADVEVGDSAAAAGKIDAMSEVIRTERLDRVTWLARGFAYEGYEHLREGNYERAREAFDIARRMDPMMPEAQTGCAWATLRAGRGVGQFIVEYRKALNLRWQVFKREGTANVYLVAAVVLCLTTISISILLLMRYQLVLRHDVAERMPSGWPEGATQIAGWVVLLAPLFAWTGGVWLLLYWFVLLARYMSAKERALAAVACVATIVVGPLAAWGAATAEISSDPTNVAVGAALQGGYGADVITALQEALNSNPDAVSLRLLLANTYERADLRREAFEEYHRILQEHRDDARALINVGNLYMRQGQTAQAIVYYTRAAEAESHNALCFYNLSIAQNDALRLSDAESSVRMVQQLDPGLARSLVTARARGEEIPPLPASASAEEVWKQVGLRSAAAMVKGNLRPASPTTLGAALSIILIGGISLLRGGLRAQTCSRCGEPFCGRCKRELGARECCAQCIHMFVKKETIAGDVRARKLRQVERFVKSWKRRVRLASLLLPGSGHVLAGKTMTGALLLFGWLIPLAALGCGRWLVLRPAVPVLDLPAITTLLAVSAMVILWGIANVFTPRLPR